MKVVNVLPRDSIPSIDDPQFGSTYFGASDDEVMVVDGDPARAYPIRILSYHEIVNDTIAGRPVAVTWCPICWSAVVYDRRMDDQTLTFGMSGKLADDALVMYDRETDSEWKQPTGEAISGELGGARLTALPYAILSWDTFNAEYPDGLVLQPVHGTSSQEGPSPGAVYDMAPYEQYVDREAFGLYGMRGEGEPRPWTREDLDAKTIVIGIESDDTAVGYPVPRIEAADGPVTDSVGSLDIVLFDTPDGVQVFADPGFDYERQNDRIRAGDTWWDPVTGKSADGRHLERVPTRRLFAFAWQDAHGEDAFYEP